MRNCTLNLSLLGLLSVGVSAQAFPGAIFEVVSVGGQVGSLSQLCPLGANTHTMTLRSVSGPVFADVQLTMPFDCPGGSLHRGSGLILVSGFDSGTGTGYLCRLQMAGPSPTVVISESIAIPAFRPVGLVYNSAEARIYLLDPFSSLLRIGSWSGSGVLPSQWTLVDPNSPFPLSHMETRPGGMGGVYLYNASPSERNVSFEPIDRCEVYHGASPGWVVNFSVATPSLVDPIAWAVDDPHLLGHHGPLRVLGQAAPCSVVDSETLASVGSLAMGSTSQWSSLTLSGDLVPGRSYRIHGGTIADSIQLWPTYREGSPVGDGLYSIRHGTLRPPAMLVGNADFSVASSVRYHWSGQPPSTVPIPSFLWAKVGVPGPGVTITLPTGTVLINSPDATIGPDAEDTPVDPASLVSRLHFGVPIPNNDLLVGVPIVFQFVAISPSGQPMVSDVFGSSIRGQASGLSGALAQPQSGAGSAAAVPMHARCAMCREWLRGQGMGHPFQQAFYASVAARFTGQQAGW